jgi:hypothetical protein
VGGHSVVPLGLLAALTVAAGAAWLVGRIRGQRRPGASPWLFFALPLLAYALQELFERLIGAEAAPFHAALEPRFAIGLLLQVPLGLVALFVARVLLRVARRVFSALERRRSVIVARCLVAVRHPFVQVLPRLPALALGYSPRGPPTA